MPRYKHPQKLPEEQERIIFGMGNDPDGLVVQKTPPMLMLHNSQLDLFDLKLLDTYLGRINSHDMTNREICFKKGELEDLFGVNRIRSEVLSTHLKRLLQPIQLDIKDPNGEGWLMFHLFSKAKAYKSNEDGLWTISMKCSEEALQFVFFPEQIGYLRYFLREISKLQSKYSYRLFILLESRRSSGLVQMYDLDELKKILGCDDTATYKEFKDFNKFVLRKSQLELAEKTKCRFTYETLNYDQHGRTFRRVAAVRFTLDPLESLSEPVRPISDSEQGALSPVAPADPTTPPPSSVHVKPENCESASLRSNATGLTAEQIQTLRLLAEQIVHATGDQSGSVDDIVMEHISLAHAHKARNVFAYTRKSIKNAAVEAIKAVQQEAAMREERERRAKRDMERAMRLLAQFDDDDE